MRQFRLRTFSKMKRMPHCRFTDCWKALPQEVRRLQSAQTSRSRGMPRESGMPGIGSGSILFICIQPPAPMLL